MKLLFFPYGCKKIHPNLSEEEGLGGTEAAIIHLTESLHDLGHDVSVVAEKEFVIEGKPKYITKDKAYLMENIDAVIVVKGIGGVFYPFKTKKIFFWTGDDWNNPTTMGLGDKRVVDKIDGLFAVSEWQAKTFVKSSNFPKDKIFILRNGVELAFFEGSEERQKGRLIYASSPYRGLYLLPSIFLELKKRHPHIELHVFSGVDLYLSKERQLTPLLEKYQKDSQDLQGILSGLKGCHIHGNIAQKELAKEMMRSQILVYPCIAEETSSMVVLEAQAAGCAIVTTDLAALEESVGKAGILIRENPSTSRYKEKFIEACDTLLKSEDIFKKYSQTALEQAKDYSWKARAQELINYL